MYLYKVGYGTCEESHYVELMHEKKFTEAELAVEMEEALWVTIEGVADGKDNIFIADDGPSFQYLIDSTLFVDALVAKGFTALQYEATWSAFGWASAMEEKGWKSYMSDEDLALSNRLGARMKAAGITLGVKIHPPTESDGKPWSERALIREK